MALSSHIFMKKVLSFAYQRDSQQKRDQWLQRSGFDVTSVNTVKDAADLLKKLPIEILIVGPAVPQDEREYAAVVARSRKTRTIYLYKNTISKAESADAVISVDGSFDNLLEAIHSLGEKNVAK